MVELTTGIVELSMKLDEFSLAFNETFTCDEVERSWENCDRVALKSRVGCTTTELVFSDADGNTWMKVVATGWDTTDDTRVELTLTEAVEDTLTTGVDTKLGCTILVVYTT